MGLRKPGQKVLPPPGPQSKADIGAPGADSGPTEGSFSQRRQTRRGRRRGPEAWGAGRGAVLRNREKEGGCGRRSGLLSRRGRGCLAGVSVRPQGTEPRAAKPRESR